MIQVTVEIPYQSNVKYEIDAKGRLCVDRILSTSMVYPGNYGYIDETVAGDGDPIDVLILTETPFYPGSIVNCRILGMLDTEDEKGRDEKIIALPIDKVQDRNEIQSLEDLSPVTLKRIAHFFEHYKKLETGKYVTVHGFKSIEEAEKVIQHAREAFLSGHVL
jgi:inorganic pyrophosphatase